MSASFVRWRAAAVLSLIGVWAAPAMASERAVRAVSNVAPMSAYDGWVAWSEMLQDGRWALTLWHEGRRHRPNIATRDAPFDVDLGPDERGRTVALFSRCRADPSNSPTYLTVPGYFSPAGIPLWSRASECRLRRLDLASGKETRLKPPGARDGSDTTPSQWRGSIAFGRRTSSSNVTQLLLWTPSNGKLRRLPGGPVPRRCPYRGGCIGSEYLGDVQQLDLGKQLAAFLWVVKAPSVAGMGTAWEIRADRLKGTGRFLLAVGTESGTCGAGHPVAPSVVGLAVWFAEVTYDCEENPHTFVSRADTATGVIRGDESSQPTWMLARDHSALYLLHGPAPTPRTNDVPCQASGAPCQLYINETPRTPVGTRRTPSDPFF